MSMSGSYRTNGSEFFAKLSGYNTYAQEKPHWNNEYRDTIRLLEQKLHNAVRLNERLRNNISSRDRFLEVNVSEIIVNLTEFKEAYRIRFIHPDVEGYCSKFIQVFVPVLRDFLREIHYGGYGFKFKFKLEGKIFEIITTVLLP